MTVRSINSMIEIETIKKAAKKYIIEFDGKIYETNYESSIIYIMHEQYVDSDDNYIKILERIDFAKELMLYSIMEGLNLEIWIGNEKIRHNNISDKEFENIDVIINIEDELSMFSAINKIGYAKIYTKNDNDKYILI